jgi:uncharacterized protein (DUF433 family)
MRNYLINNNRKYNDNQQKCMVNKHIIQDNTILSTRKRLRGTRLSITDIIGILNNKKEKDYTYISQEQFDACLIEYYNNRSMYNVYKEGELNINIFDHLFDLKSSM